MNLKNKLSSFEFKTILYITSFVVILLLLLWGSLLLIFNVFFENYQLEMVNNIAGNLPQNEENIDTILDDTAYKNDVCIIRVVDGIVVGNYNIKKVGCVFNQKSEYINNSINDFIASTEQKKQLQFVNDENETESVLVAQKTSDSSIFIYTNLEDTSHVTSLFRELMLFLTIAAVLVAILISYFLSRKIIEPITNITTKAKFLGTGKDLVFEKNGLKEVDELVDALNKAQSEIGKTDALKRDLMANVSHDLKTPLTMIKAYAEMVKDISYKDKSKLDEHLNIIIDETDRLNVLVNDILDMSKMQTMKDVLKKEKFDLIKEINNIVRKFQIIKETENYKFILNVPKTLNINADKSKINQAIYNLLSNAINYTGNNKEVYINIKKQTFGILIEIIDTGKGIKDSQINNIWDKYYKTEKKHQRNVISTGIGLSIVKEIFLLHNYEYGVKSTSKGTTFYFVIK